MSYAENRVLVKVYGSLPSDSSLLVPVPTTAGRPQQRLHVLAAHALSMLSGAAQKDLKFPLLGASCWRPHRWASWEEYVKFVTTKYGSLERGRRFLAFDSPHETGLAIDFGCGGLAPVSATIDHQKTMPLFKWLVINAWYYGWTPYMVEPWHWEFHLPLEDYKSGIASTPTPAEQQTAAHPEDVCEDHSSTRTPAPLTTSLPGKVT